MGGRTSKRDKKARPIRWGWERDRGMTAADDGSGKADGLPSVGGRASRVAREESRARAERDQLLVERARQGDRAAFRELYDHYHRRAYLLAESVVKDREEAMDVVQEAFVKVHRHLDGFQGGSSFYTWLYRIVMNLAIDQARKSKRQRTVDFDDALGHESEGALEGGPQGGFEDQNPRKALLRKELAERIRRALADLPEYHQAVIVLREVDGLSYEELAEVMEVPKGTIMSRLFHARRKMQEALGTYLDRDLEIED